MKQKHTGTVMIQESLVVEPDLILQKEKIVTQNRYEKKIDWKYALK